MCVKGKLFCLLEVDVFGIKKISQKMETETAEDLRLFVGGAFEIGGKLSQEDYIVCISNLNQFIPNNSQENTKRSFYAVFDGKIELSLLLSFLF